MKITDATIQMMSNHVYQEEMVKEESLLAWVGDERPVSEEDSDVMPQAPRQLLDSADFSVEALTQQVKKQAVVSEVENPLEDHLASDPELRVIQLILEGLTGRKIRVTEFEEQQIDEVPEPITDSGNPVESEEQPRVDWGLEYDYYESYAEHELTTFTANGFIKTADGRDVDFDAKFIMTRDFFESTSITIREGDARFVDPLVINFDGQAADLTDMKFAFDLDFDGDEEQISFVGPGSGFLVFDRNNDGVVNGGHELFGPETGDGFDELAKYDSDGNGWLDENDPMYEKLRIWTKSIAGDNYLFSLKDKNIGALLLGTESTPFNFKDHRNTLQGQLKETSIFIREDGTVGSVQEINFVV